MNKHKIMMSVSFYMDEMDGTPEQSAEIAEEIMVAIVREHTAWFGVRAEARDFYVATGTF